MDVALPVPARWVTGRQKGSRVLVDPYNTRMRKKHEDKNNVYFWCSRRTDLDCRVTVAVKKSSDEIIQHSGEHNHDSDLMKTLVTEKYQKTVTNAIENVTVAPRTAFKDLTNQIMVDSSTAASGLFHLPKPRSMARTIQKKRKNAHDMPDLPRNWEEMSVPDQFKETSDGQCFLTLEAVVPGSYKKVSLHNHSCISCVFLMYFCPI